MIKTYTETLTKTFLNPEFSHVTYFFSGVDGNGYTRPWYVGKLSFLFCCSTHLGGKESHPVGGRGREPVACRCYQIGSKVTVVKVKGHRLVLGFYTLHFRSLFLLSMK